MHLVVRSNMSTAYAKVGAILWVPPDEIQSMLRYRNYSEEIQLELSDWIARMFSMAFVAGQRSVTPPNVQEMNVLTMLRKMGYCEHRARELTSLVMDSLPGLYAKGQSRACLH